MARKKRASSQEVAEHFESLPKGAGSTEERLHATARYFKITPLTARKHIQFWWPGPKFLKEFGDGRKRKRPHWDRPTKELLAALNKHGNVSRAAKALGTTPVTLAKAIERHNLAQEWVVKKS